MIAKVRTVSFSGINVIDIAVEVHSAKGQPGLTIVGLGDKAITESRDRIRAALSSINITLPATRITINLAPADIIKEGSHFDLPIALGILVILNVIKQQDIENYIAMGELSLDSSIRHVNGVLPAAMHSAVNEVGIICPFDNGQEAAWGGEDLNVVAIKNLTSLINHLSGKERVPKPVIAESQLINAYNGDIADVKGQKNAKRALEIAASGGHNLLMIGPPGIGKSMLASRITTILPPLDTKEMLDVSMIHSIAGLIKNGVLSTERPFCSPHHSASMASIIGGGRNATPGEVTIAHNGVLFLDEIPEYQRQVLESLRQPMETGTVYVSRVNFKVQYPANFQLIAAMNPCHCGYFGVKNRECGKVPMCAAQYQAKISGPLMDRIDLCIRMDPDPVNIFDKTQKDVKTDSSEVIRKRVVRTRQIQRERYEKHGYQFSTNSRLDGELLQEYCTPRDTVASDALTSIIERLKLSMRGTTKILRVARTIADMRESANIEKQDLIEAAIFRNS